ncbi:MAG TPA: response regulator [Terriglobales bacterium]|jgi:DNA-binding NtrC family response regulator|nr:response regulator [Terriglobales bacterium]
MSLPLLVIEDEAAVQAFLRAALERSGYQIVVATSGEEGLQLLKEREFGGIVSDMRTPGEVDGADVHEWLQANRPEMVKRMLFVTGDIVNEETMQTLRRTGVPCIEKPFRVHELVSAVKEVMEK